MPMVKVLVGAETNFTNESEKGLKATTEALVSMAAEMPTGLDQATLVPVKVASLRKISLLASPNANNALLPAPAIDFANPNLSSPATAGAAVLSVCRMGCPPFVDLYQSIPPAALSL